MTGFEPIVACATAWGHSSIAVVRLSGIGLAPLVTAICGRLSPPGSARKVRLRDDVGIFDEGLLLWMPAPASYTGEDVAEISCHGNPLLVERLIAAAVALGARIAGPGEFTRRALLNGKLDLCRAEAVLQTIEASSSLGLEIARSGLDGRLQQAFSEIRERLVETAAELEAILDYPGEDLIFSSDQELIQRLNQGVKQAQALAGSYQSGRIALQGARISLVGPVNAGKSSLFNALLGKARALVSPQPGTTRDVVESPLQLDQVRILLCDTAGIRETVDPIEAEGVELARSSSMEADLRLLVVPLTRLRELQDTLSWMQSLPKPAILVGTHADQERPADFEGLMVSSKTGAGIMELKKAILHQLNLENTMETQLLLGSQRQRDLLLRISEHTQAAILGLQEAGPAVAAERLYEAIGTADELDGKNTREDVLDRLFQRFCVGK